MCSSRLLRAIVVLLLILPSLAVLAQESSSNVAFDLTDSINSSICPDVVLTGPTNPSFVAFDQIIGYRWQGEPASTAHRIVVVFGVGTAGSGSGDASLSGFNGSNASFGITNDFITQEAPRSGAANFGLGELGSEGTYNWMVVFLDAEGQILCRSDNAWLDVRAPSEVVRLPVNLPAETSITPIIMVDPCGGGLIIVVLVNSPYTGTYDIFVNDTIYHGSGCDEEIHGNDDINELLGGGGNDRIFGYGDDDIIDGQNGDDLLDGGSGNDIVYGGSGSDTIEGGTGFDTLYGGNNNAGGGIGDDIGSDNVSDNGGDDGDILFGGNNNSMGGAGDDGDDIVTDSGGTGDILFGGNNNNDNGTGNDGNDTITDSGTVGSDILLGGNSNTNNGTGNDGDDVITDNGGDNDNIWGGNDNLTNGTGNDGNDTITDNGGTNDFVFGGNSNMNGGSGVDNSAGGGDHIDTQDGADNDIVECGNQLGTDGDGTSDTTSTDATDIVNNCP